MECKQLLEFQKFLQHTKTNGEVNSSELKPSAMTRTQNETYPVSVNELRAEIIATLGEQLRSKSCPQNFQLALLRAVLQEVENDCKTAKDVGFVCGGDAETAYDLTKLQKYALNILEKLLTRLSDNTEAGNLKNYAAEPGLLCAETSLECSCESRHAAAAPFQHAKALLKNKPRKMEDRLVCIDNYSAVYELEQLYSFYAVFDGHSGPLAASYAASQLPYVLAQQLKLLQVDDDDARSMREVFQRAFLQVDEAFNQKQISSGTTATCVLLTHTQPTKLYTAWVGDSKLLLVEPKVSMQLVRPHKPHMEHERARIEATAEQDGGAIMHVQGQWRLNGILNVSRTIGDYFVRSAIAEPDFKHMHLSPQQDFMLLASDGLWDYVPETAVSQNVYAALADEQLDLQQIPKLLIDMAKAQDSLDNISVILLLLRERAQIVKQYNSMEPELNGGDGGGA